MRTLTIPLVCGLSIAHAALPVTFEENRGQAASNVTFLSRASDYCVLLTGRGAIIALAGGSVVRIRLAGSPDTTPVGTHRLLAKTNYLLGPDRSRWRTGIPNYQGVTYGQVYPGVDMTWHAHGNDIEHDFLVAPGADPRRIRLVFSGVALRLTGEGDLVAGPLRFHKPRAYEAGREVKCRYELHGRSVRFALDPYDRARPLIIDPVLTFSTFLGGTNDTGTMIYPAATAAAATALDRSGNIYVAGVTSSLDFPAAAGAFQRTATGGICGYNFVPKVGNVPYPCLDIFVAKFSGDGSTLLNATYLAGPGNNSATAISVGPAGDIYLLGIASQGFPKLTPLPGQTIQPTYQPFVAELSADLSSLLYATALPASPSAMTVDAAGAVYLTGNTAGGLPAVNALQPASADGGFFFKTTDIGQHWQSLTNGLSVVEFLVADPTNPQVFYAGGAPSGGSSSAGLFKTTDGGVHWTSILTGVDPAAFPEALVIDPRTPQTLYLGVFPPGAASPGVYKSTDGGATWVGSGNGGGTPMDVSTMAIDPVNPSILYAGAYDGLYKSTDGAATWNKTSLSVVYLAPPQRPLTPVLVDPGSHATLYTATGSGLMKSTDGGATWSSINLSSNGFPPRAPVMALAMDPSSPQTLYAGGPGFVFKTTDGGANWTQSPWPPSGGLVLFIMVDPQLHSRIWVATSKGVYLSPDSGTSWTRTSLPHLSVPGLAANSVGGVYAIRDGGILSDAFAMKLDATGSNLVYSTYLGGIGRDVAGGIAVDASGRAYIAGETDSPDFPIAAALQPNLGGDSDVFLTVLNPAGSQLVWSTYLGSRGAQGATSIALDPAGNVHLAGVASLTIPLVSADPNREPSDDAFAAKIKGDGSALIFSTRLGGSDFDRPNGVAADAAGNTYIAGTTASKDLPTLNAVQTTLAGGANAMVAKFDGLSGALQYATYLGGSQYDYGTGLAADAAGNAYVVGQTSSPDFPLQSAWQSALNTTSAFVAKLAAQGPTPGMINLTNAASYTAPVAPGELISIFGTGLAANTAAASQLPLPMQLLDAQVTVSGVSVPLVYASPGQINAQIPFETQPGTAQVQVSSSAGTSTVTMQVAATAPAIFTINQRGTGPGAILHGTSYQVVSDTNPVAAGEIISIYCTGLGAVDPPAQTGATPPDPPPHTVIRLQVAIAGATVQPSYAGVAPGFPGLYQVNVQVPTGTPSGAQPVQIIQNGVASNTVTLAVQ